jgi:TatD DNase family protein
MDDFDKDRAGAIARALEAGVGTIITVGTNLESSKKAIELAERSPQVYAAVGFHPHDVSTISEADITSLGEIACHPRVVAIGEVGLDFYRNYSPREAQLQALRWQLDLSAELELPVIIHCRRAEKDMLALLRSWISGQRTSQRQYRGVIHCFSSDGGTAGEYLDMGFYLSLGAYIGYPTSSNMHSVIRNIPGDRLLVETDCPFLPPQGHRGKRNEPAYLPLTVETLAAIREESCDNIARATTQNACQLFHLPVL